MSVRVEVKSKLGRVARQFPDEVRTIIREQVLESEGNVKINIVKYDAIDTGAMFGSVKGEMTGDLEGEVSVNAQSDDGFPYPIVVDKGGAHVAGRPFFSDEAERARQTFPDKFRGIGGRLT